jgi:hypothetical protein
MQPTAAVSHETKPDHWQQELPNGNDAKSTQPNELSLRKIVALLHDLNIEQKRYEMRLAENREHREKLLRWLLCVKKSDYYDLRSGDDVVDSNHPHDAATKL